MSLSKHQLWLAVGFGLLCLGFTALPAHADVRRRGEWPSDNEERISLTFEGPRSKALRALAGAAGWSIIDNPGSATFAGAGDTVNVFVTDQPAVKVLELLLSDGDYVVKRDGKLLSITVHAPGSGPKAPDSLPPPPPPFPSTEPDPAARPALVRNAEDRTVLGSSTVIAKEEVVNNLTLLGGSVELRGTVQEDVLVMGGSLVVHEGARVYGDVAVLGGNVELKDGARVDGDLSSAGGHIQRAAGAILRGDEIAIGGSKSIEGKSKQTQLDDNDDEDEENDEAKEEKSEESWSFAAVMDKLGSALSRAALLYAFGCVLLATASAPMQRMQTELAERPMQAFGIGLATLIGGCFALIVLCVTIIGIPIAILLFLLGALGVYAGMCAVFLELGALVLEDRTPSPYAHLALGCLMYLIFSTLPVIGWLATSAAVLCGLGLLVSTRFAGLIGRPPSQLSASAPT
jgi:cytoskeletal protein CcmA (bactofilin family)